MEPSTEIYCSLSEIQKCLPDSICSTLLEIQKYQFCKDRSIEWISNLECLSIPPKPGRKRRHGDDGESVEVEPIETVFRRRRINPLEKSEERDYIAVSWVWEAEPEEELTSKRYLIESRDGGQQVRSPVRDIVLDRVIKYANHLSCRHFWIDKICINQDDKEEVEVATQAMDLVYSLSQQSLGIINRHNVTLDQLNLLMRLMKGEYVSRKGNLSMAHEAGKALKLVQWLTSASWWMRAWTFQEDYKARVNMTLLISHKPSLEQSKRSTRVFERVPGELCINSANFRTEVTRFCQAYLQEFRSDQEEMRICNEILERAGKYTIRLREKAEDGDYIIRKTMSPTVLADIGARQITKPWDRLAIMANCCNYDIRLNANELRDRKFSQSLAILTQYMLNGEIVNNEQKSKPSPTQNIMDFLKNQSLDSFKSPIKNQLTFIKSCRLPKVELVNEGVQTFGHLWKVGKRIEVKCENKLSEKYSTRNSFKRPERDLLKQLARELGTGIHGRRYKTLADDITHYLDDEGKRSKDSCAEIYMFRMAREVSYAMTDQGKVLRLGCLVGGSQNEHQPYRGIFICDVNEQGPEYVFTAYRQSRRQSEEIDKHVSLGVELLNPNAEGLPELITKKWVSGLYFASGLERRTVLLPWPEFLKT